MDSKKASPIQYDLVLVGCGHAHAHVLKMIGMQRMKHNINQESLTELGIQVTIISSHYHTPYSGMLPGYIAGHYTERNDIQLNVMQLARFANVKFVHATVNRITYNNSSSSNTSTVGGVGGGGYIYTTDHRPPIRYDCLSINIGSAPSMHQFTVPPPPPPPPTTTVFPSSLPPLPIRIPPSLSISSPLQLSESQQQPQQQPHRLENNNETTTPTTTTPTDTAVIIPVKPIANLCQYWDMVVLEYQHYLNDCMSAMSSNTNSKTIFTTTTTNNDTTNSTNSSTIPSPYTIAVIGGGAGGIELALSIQYRLMTITMAALSSSSSLSSVVEGSRISDESSPPQKKNVAAIEEEVEVSKYLQVMIITRGKTLSLQQPMSDQQPNRRVIRTFQDRILPHRNIIVHYHAEVERVIPISSSLIDDTVSSSSKCSTGTRTPPKLEHAVLENDNNSSINGNHYLVTATTASNTSLRRQRRKIIFKNKSNATTATATTTISPIIVVDVCFSCITGTAASWLSNATPFTTTAMSSTTTTTTTTTTNTTDQPNGNYIRVNPTYECIHHPGVFATGDCCHIDQYPRPKAGVFAVRAGPILYTNLLRYMRQNTTNTKHDHHHRRRLKKHRPQSTYLSLIGTGNKYAVAVKGRFICTEGKFVWHVKDYIDRKWMAKYSTDLPDLETMMKEQQQQSKWWWTIQFNRNKQFRTKKSLTNNQNNITRDALAAFQEHPMRCGGCGSKVGATIVSRVLQTVHERQVRRAQELGSCTVPPPIDHDDAAITYLPTTNHGNSNSGSDGGAIIQTIDYFREMITDPYIFGKVVAVHALSDIHAMGITAQTALVLAVVPFAANDDITESTLLHLLSGVSDILQDEHVQLVGGHTCEGMELSCGLSIQGYSSDPSKLWRKRGGQIGDHIIVTKPIGTGALFAAEMRAMVHGEYVQEAIECMLQSNYRPSSAAREYCNRHSTDGINVVNACTDVTGFGLIGHLLEMLLANESVATSTDHSIGAVLNINRIPFYRGGIDASTKHIFSSLQKQNERNRRAIVDHSTTAMTHPIQYPLLFDPQTAGGLLFFVNPKYSTDFLSHLVKEGHASYASLIGEVVSYTSQMTVDDNNGIISPMMSSEPCVIGNHNNNGRASTENRIRVI